jgi:hypothetical protein
MIYIIIALVGGLVLFTDVPRWIGYGAAAGLIVGVIYYGLVKK